MSKKIAVTGVGFIGSWVVDNLLSKGYEVIAFDHYKRADYPKGVEVVLGDIRDANSIRQLVAHSEGVIHLAGQLGTQEHVLNPRPISETNILGGLNLLEAVAEYKVPMVNIAVGNWDHNNPYSISKHTIERYINMYNKERGTSINIVRGVNCYGPRQVAAPPFGPSKIKKVTPSFICRALSNMPIEVYGDGEQVSDFVWVGDMAEALVRALEKADQGIVFEEAVECGPEENVTVNEVANLIRELCYEVFDRPSPEVVHLPMRPGEKPNSRIVANTATLKLVGMNPKDFKPLRDGMIETIQYFVDTEGKAWNKPEGEIGRITGLA
jgi:UDP-glucose 4-epimerase